MHKINIFIAGAKDLADQRMKLKATISDMNHRYAKEGRFFQLAPTSYETYGNDQDKYNDYISHEADLVIFILEGRIGKVTEDEYTLASRIKNKKNVPEVVVMVKAYDHLTADIAYINGLMRNDKYYYTYKTDEELMLKTQNYLDEFVKRYHPKPIKRLTSLFSFRFKGLIMALLILLVGIGTFIGGRIHRDNTQVLLLTGGGSAKNFIEKLRGIDLNNYRDAYYVHMPSKNAWLLLTEEVISPQKDSRYCPVCISATAATDEDFTHITTTQYFLEKGSVIAVNIGSDTLVVSVKNDPTICRFLGQECLQSGEISVDKLWQLISMQDSLNVFATSQESGTRTTYEKTFASKQAQLSQLNIRQFSEDSDMPTININNKPYILLGSQCYVMKEVEKKVAEKQAFFLKVYDLDNGQKYYCSKDMYIYFLGKKEGNSHDLTIPKPVLRLLKDLDYDLDSKVKDGKVKRYNDTKVIQEYDKLENWRTDK